MASAFTSTLTLLALIAATSANAGLIPGGGPTKSDCYLELDVAGIENGTPRVEKNKIVLCTDGEACDTGACGDSSCTLSIAACINQTDPSLACTPPTGLQKLNIKGRLNVQAPQLLEGPQCGQPLSVTIPVKFNKKGKPLPKKSKVTLKGVGKGSRGPSRAPTMTMGHQCLPRTVDARLPPRRHDDDHDDDHLDDPPARMRSTDHVAERQGRACRSSGHPPAVVAQRRHPLHDNCRIQPCGDDDARLHECAHRAVTAVSTRRRVARHQDPRVRRPEHRRRRSGLDAGPTPDCGRIRFNWRSDNDPDCRASPTDQACGEATADADCTSAGCNFGRRCRSRECRAGPLPPLGACVLNTLKEARQRNAQLGPGEAS